MLSNVSSLLKEHDTMQTPEGLDQSGDLTVKRAKPKS